VVGPARRRLLSWYRRHGRHDLPWRKTRDPYRVLVSEIMLQQTTVAATLPYYHRFLKRFPTLRSLAGARLEQVLSVWSGLGYYARARHLHQASRMILERHKGRVPEELEELRELPGIGRYTAGAIRSLAFGKPAPILDGNVTRILSRFLAIREDVHMEAVQKRLWSHAEAFADCAQARDVNLALFDLGAILCKPGEPLCGICPLAALCKARALRIQEQVPFKGLPMKRRSVQWLVPIVQRGDLVLMGLRERKGLFGGLWELPTFEAVRGRSPVETLEQTLKGWGISVTVDRSLPAVSHVLTHRDFTMRPFLCRWVCGPLPERPSRYVRLKWVPLHEIDRMAVSSLTRKIANCYQSFTIR
jgi:A/G-specific adenine glycosylase